MKYTFPSYRNNLVRVEGQQKYPNNINAERNSREQHKTKNKKLIHSRSGKHRLERV